MDDMEKPETGFLYHEMYMYNVIYMYERQSLETSWILIFPSVGAILFSIFSRLSSASQITKFLRLDTWKNVWLQNLFLKHLKFVINISVD